jgi:hypothetical protein
MEDSMDYIPCKDRTFQFTLTPWYRAQFNSTLRWLKHLLERLGQPNTDEIWKRAFMDYDDSLLMKVLSAEWDESDTNETNTIEDQIHSLVSEFFPVPVEGVTGEAARQLIEQTPPIRQTRIHFPSLNYGREITTYEVLLLRFDGLASLVKSMITLHGKQGELIAYDLCLEDRISAGRGRTGSVGEFIADFSTEPPEPNMFTAGLESEIVHRSEREAVIHMKECEWARYFQEHHPEVGYLIACSTDEAGMKAFNQNLRMQRTTTIMEGGEICDFRIYAVEGDPPVSDQR